LRDFTFIDDGNPNIYKGTDLINFDKCSKLANIVKYIEVFFFSFFQKLLFYFLFFRALICFLKKKVSRKYQYQLIEVPQLSSRFQKTNVISDENEQYSLSLQVEP